MLNISNIWVTTQRVALKDNGLPNGIRIRHGKYHAELCIGGERTRLGKFESLQEAEIVYLKARIARDKRYIQEGVEAVEKRLEALTECEGVAA